MDRFGGLHVLVNNAGVSGDRFGGLAPIEETALPNWNKVIEINLTGSFLGIKHAAPAIRTSVAPLRARDERIAGSIINIASAQAKRPSPFQASYAATKWALRGLTRVAAVELAPDIRVNSVLPGVIRTPMVEPMLETNSAILNTLIGDTPLARLGTAEEVAYMVLFLASDESSYSTGAEFMIEGGRTAAVTRPR